MTEISTELIRRLVVRRKQDCRCVYDPQVKAQIVQACLRPGVSVARMALQCDLNASLLRRWIGKRHKQGSNMPVAILVARSMRPLYQPS